MRPRRALAQVLSPAVRLFLGLGIGFGIANCNGIEPVAISEPISDPAKLFARLELDRRMITMSTVAPYDTIKITPTAFNLSGDEIPGLLPTYRWTDSTAMVVSPDGVLHALHAATGVKVIAEVVIPGNVRHTDTSFVDITELAAPPRLASLTWEQSEDLIRSIPASHPGHNPDINVVFTSPVYLFFGFFGPTPAINALDSTGNVMAGLRVEVVGLDRKINDLGACVRGTIFGCIATVGDRIDASGYNPGLGRMVVRATAYGITMADTTAWHVVWPVLSTIYIQKGPDGKSQFVPSEARLNPGGLVNWWNFTDDTVDVTFDDPTNVAMPVADACQIYVDGLDYSYGPGPHCGTGNVLVPGPGGPPPDDPFFELYSPNEIIDARAKWNSQLRQLSVPGIYRFRSTRTGATGQIIVTTNPTGTYP